MRVAQVLYSGLGGHGSVAFSLVRQGLATHSWAPSLVFVGIEPVLQDYRRFCDDKSVPFLAIRTIPGRPWQAWPAILRALQKVRPDALVVHSVKTILPCALYARLNGIPLIAVEHQNNALKLPVEWSVSRQVMRWADEVIVLTDEYRSQLSLGLGRHFNHGKTRVIPNGVDVDWFTPAPAPRRITGPRTIGMASRFTTIKRHDILIDAMARLRARDGEDHWRLSLAGTGETLQECRERVQAQKLEGLVDFPGHLDGAALRDWFRSLHVYAHASAGETLSTSILQAFATGLPVVGSDVAGIAGLLSAGGGVGLAVSQEPAAFADALQKLDSEPDLAEQTGHRARTLAIEAYSHAAMFTQYNELLGSKCHP